MIAAGALALEKPATRESRGRCTVNLIGGLADHRLIPPYIAPAICSPSRVGLPSSDS